MWFEVVWMYLFNSTPSLNHIPKKKTKQIIFLSLKVFCFKGHPFSCDNNEIKLKEFRLALLMFPRSLHHSWHPLQIFNVSKDILKIYVLFKCRRCFFGLHLSTNKTIFVVPTFESLDKNIFFFLSCMTIFMRIINKNEQINDERTK